MKQIAIYSPKGGVGRTTISLHLADRLTASGRHVFLRDQDPQASALAFALLADQAGAPLQYTVGRGVPPQGTDITITDYGPQELAMFPAADLIIVPVVLDGVSLSVGLRTLDRLARTGAPVLPVISRYRADRAEHRLAARDKTLEDAVVVSDRAALAGYYALGRLVHDPAYGKQRSAVAARTDLDNLCAAVLERIDPMGIPDVFADVFRGTEVAHG